MHVTDIELEALRKFNSGKNAEALSNELDPGSYPVKFTVTLEGQLNKGNPGMTRSRNTTGAANMLRYLLDRINESTYQCMVRDLATIRKGEFDVKNGTSRFDERLETVMPYREYPRDGSTRFNGSVTIEDIVESPTIDTDRKGLELYQAHGVQFVQGS